jgi:hypothetical protein
MKPKPPVHRFGEDVEFDAWWETEGCHIHLPSGVMDTAYAAWVKSRSTFVRRYLQQNPNAYVWHDLKVWIVISVNNDEGEETCTLRPASGSSAVTKTVSLDDSDLTPYYPH